MYLFYGIPLEGYCRKGSLCFMAICFGRYILFYVITLEKIFFIQIE